MNEAELVHSRVLNCDRLSLYLNKNRTLSRAKTAEISRILKRRSNGEPLQYILGSTEFMGLEIKTDSRALIPRPETEILAGWVLEKMKSLAHAPKLLDLGTGSGCIAVSAAKLCPAAHVWASDISILALQLAKINADFNRVKVKFIYSDLFRALENKAELFDIIASNPPYIAAKEFPSLAREIFFEPFLALSAGRDGLEFYRQIIAQAPRFLKDHGWLVLEMGAGQRRSIEALIKKTKKFGSIEIIKDYNNIERVIAAQKARASAIPLKRWALAQKARASRDKDHKKSGRLNRLFRG